MMNSLLILPAAAARITGRSIRGYTFWAVGMSLFSGVCGLIVSYYTGTASGATIVLFAATLYVICVIVGRLRRSA